MYDDLCYRMMVALEGLWRDNCMLDPMLLCQTIADVAQAHFRVYVIYCTNATYQNRKLSQLMSVIFLIYQLLNHQFC